MLSKVKLFLWLCILGILLITACSYPRLVVQSTFSKGEAKFLWDDRKKRGIVRCDMAENGALTNCRDINVEFR